MFESVAPDAGEVSIDGAVVALARSRAERRAVQLVFQDPFSSLNPRMSIGAMLNELLVSHDLALVSEICDQVVVMRHGAVVERGDMMEVLSRPSHPYTQSLIANHLKYGLEAYA